MSTGGEGSGPYSEKLLQRKDAIVLGLSFSLILDFENSENERKDDEGEKIPATLNESVVRIF